VSTSDGDRLVKAYGPVRGADQHRIERKGMGCRQFFRFLKHIAGYCKETPTWKWTLSSDNISLVNQVTGQDDEDDANNDGHHIDPY
jgi:hypothetical protein